MSITEYLYQGACGCGWHGGWQESDADAKKDSQEHCEESGCQLSDRLVEQEYRDDLMPHERSSYGAPRAK